MDTVCANAIDVVEAAYDIDRDATDWLARLLTSGGTAFDAGLGCVAAVCAGAAPDGEPLIASTYVHRGAPDLALRLARSARDVGADLRQVTALAHAGGVRVVSECSDWLPQGAATLLRSVGCHDILFVWAVDSNLHGVVIAIPSRAKCSLSPSARRRWQLVAGHISAAHHLRRGLGHVADIGGTPLGSLPLDASALADSNLLATRLPTVEATREAQRLRGIAVEVDRMREAGQVSAAYARRLWQELMRGECSRVDSFQSDGRRFILIKRNDPRCVDPRHLTQRERDVLAHARFGESHKVVGYRLGLSASRVSALATSAMRKLGVKTRAELMLHMRCFDNKSAA